MEKNEKFDKLEKWMLSKLSEMKTTKSKDEARRILCCSIMGHRVEDQHSPVSRMQIYNTKAVEAIKTTQEGIAGYLLSPSVRWFRYATKGKDFQDSDLLYGANDWLELTEQYQYALYSNSRFYPISFEAIGDNLIYGTSYEMVTDDVENQKVIFDLYSPFECYISEDSQRRVNTWFREYSLTAEQAYEEWGEDCTEAIRNLLSKKAGATECKFIHAIFPRSKAEIADVPIPESASKKYASVHYCETEGQIFKVSGYDEFPLSVHRHRLATGSPYGVSLVSMYLEKICELQEQQKLYDTAIAKLVNPPVIVPTALAGKFSQKPNTIMYADTQGSGKPESVSTTLDIAAMRENIKTDEEILNRVLYANLFNVLMMQDRQRTAYEVQQLKGEGLVLLSAIIGNMQEEMINPLILRTLGIMLRNRLIQEPPKELKEAWTEGRVEVELTGPLAQMMEQYHQTAGMTQGLQWISSWAKLFPESIVNIDGDFGMRKGAASFGFPQRGIKEVADVQKIKEVQAQTQAQKQQQEDALVQSQILKNTNGIDPQALVAQGTIPQQMYQQGVNPLAM